MVDKDLFLKQLIQEIAPHSYILACWEGGSAATATTDPYSDIDLRLLVLDHSVERTFLTLEKALQSFCPIKHRRREPEPLCCRD